MCGIAGLFYFGRDGHVDETTLTRMRDTMVHRGPDGADNWISPEGRVGLAHRRLSIIDLSTSATQPMPNEDRSVWVTYNGEIYNHVPLRKSLQKAGHTFITDHSDTEILPHGYEEWGIENLVHKIEGDYSFALWDQKKEKMFLVRDRIGVKPLYFSVQNGLLLFGSEIKALLEHPDMKPDVSPIAMYHYLSFLTTPAPFTMFEGIYKLPAGYYLEVDTQGTFKAHRYWDVIDNHNPEDMPDIDPRSPEAESYYIKGIMDRLDQSVEKRMMSDVPFGVFLSGGVDSSTNVALMSRYTDKPLETFTVGFKDYTHLNELDHADSVAKLYNTHHHEVLIDKTDMVGYINDLVHHQDEPIADWVCVPLYFVSKLAKDSGVTVIQVGEGADEQFSGYASYMGYLDLYKKYWSPYRKMPSFMQHAGAKVAQGMAKLNPSYEVYADIIMRAANDRDHFWSGATVFWDIMKDQLVRPGSIPQVPLSAEIKNSGLMPESYLTPDTFEIIKSFGKDLSVKVPGHDILTRMVYNEFKLRLPELLLMRVDKVTMSNSLEARVPFLDHHLVQFSMNIPMDMKVKGHTAKYLLKKGVENLIPHDIIYRKKMGFGAPMSQWLKEDFGQDVHQAVMNSNLLTRGFFNRDYIEGLFRDHTSGRRDNSLYIWSLFNLTSWYDYWIDKKSFMAAA